MILARIKPKAILLADQLSDSDWRSMRLREADRRAAEVDRIMRRNQRRDLIAVAVWTIALFAFALGVYLHWRNS